MKWQPLLDGRRKPVGCFGLWALGNVRLRIDADLCTGTYRNREVRTSRNVTEAKMERLTGNVYTGDRSIGQREQTVRRLIHLN